MKIIFQKIQNILEQECNDINIKIRGNNFLEILKFKFLEKIADIQEVNTFQDSEDKYEQFSINDSNKHIKFKLIYNKTNTNIIEKTLEYDFLLICLTNSIEINIEDFKTKKNKKIKIRENSGITLPSETKCKINSSVKTLFLEIWYEDKLQDIEKFK